MPRGRYELDDDYFEEKSRDQQGHHLEKNESCTIPLWLSFWAIPFVRVCSHATMTLICLSLHITLLYAPMIANTNDNLFPDVCSNASHRPSHQPFTPQCTPPFTPPFTPSFTPPSAGEE
jgi:hypothetical protein